MDSHTKIEIEEKTPILIDNTKIEDIKNIILPVLIDKFQLIAQKLEKESQLNIINEYLEVTSKLLSLVEKIKNLS